MAVGSESSQYGGWWTITQALGYCSYHPSMGAVTSHWGQSFCLLYSSLPESSLLFQNIVSHQCLVLSLPAPLQLSLRACFCGRVTLGPLTYDCFCSQPVTEIQPWIKSSLSRSCLVTVLQLTKGEKMELFSTPGPQCQRSHSSNQDHKLNPRLSKTVTLSYW